MHSHCCTPMPRPKAACIRHITPQACIYRVPWALIGHTYTVFRLHPLLLKAFCCCGQLLGPASLPLLDSQTFQHVQHVNSFDSSCRSSACRYRTNAWDTTEPGICCRRVQLQMRSAETAPMTDEQKHPKFAKSQCKLRREAALLSVVTLGKHGLVPLREQQASDAAHHP